MDLDSRWDIWSREKIVFKCTATCPRGESTTFLFIFTDYSVCSLFLYDRCRNLFVFLTLRILPLPSRGQSARERGRLGDAISARRIKFYTGSLFKVIGAEGWYVRLLLISIWANEVEGRKNHRASLGVCFCAYRFYITA